MRVFHLWAQPWWVNLLLLVPALSYVYWRRAGLLLNGWVLATLALFGTAFGFVEAVVVVYLRGTLATFAQNVSTIPPPQDQPSSYEQTAALLAQIPRNLYTIEVCREAATMFMLVCVAMLAARGARERWAAFLWTFAAWDITYYVGLWATLRWPASLCDYDVLFLIPVPWYAQVWFPVLVSTLVMLSIALSLRRNTLYSAYRGSLSLNSK